MARPIRMPQPGQMTEECTILEWFKQEGDTIAKGDVLFEIETDKSNMEIEAFDEGTLLRIDAAVGTTAPVDAVVAWIGEPGEDIPDSAGEDAVPASASMPAAEPNADPVEAVAPVEAERPVTPTAAAPPASTPEPGRRLIISPRASRIAAELGVDPRTVTATGPNGRIVERDVRAAAETPATATAETPAAGAAAATAASTAAAAAAPAALTPGAPAASAAADGGEPMSRIRRIIARRLTENVTTIPQYTVTVAVDMTDLMTLRRDLKHQGSSITVTDFIHAATVQALVELPTVNWRTDGETLWRRDHVHLGIAVSIPDGLLVPVVRDADSLSIAGLHDRTVDLIERARVGKALPDELSGSTFSVSNMGMYGIEQFSAIVNPGESGIIAVGAVKPETVVRGEGIAIRHMMRLTLTADHRLVDGELGARFLNAVRSRLEDADALRAQVSAG